MKNRDLLYLFILLQECYKPSPSKLFSGLIISLTAMSSDAQQKFYAACIQHQGGQVVCSQLHQPHLYFCTHVVRDSTIHTDTSTADNRNLDIPQCQKYSTSTGDEFSIRMLHTYRFLVSLPLLSLSENIPGSSSQRYETIYQRWLQRPVNVRDLLPLEVSSKWIEECLEQLQRVAEAPYLQGDDKGSEHGTYSIDNLSADWKQQISDDGKVYVPAAASSSSSNFPSICPTAAGSTNLTVRESHGHADEESRIYSSHEQLFLQHLRVASRKRSECGPYMYICSV